MLARNPSLVLSIEKLAHRRMGLVFVLALILYPPKAWHTQKIEQILGSSTDLVERYVPLQVPPRLSKFKTVGQNPESKRLLRCRCCVTGLHVI
jgi:hypothetical protein